MRFELPYLEMLITYRCTMRCDGCANYSNLGLKHQASFQDNKEFIRMWGKRLAPKTLRILGGEPALHDELLDYIRLAREIWPDTERWLVTNGTIVDRREGLGEVLAETGTKVHFSFHSNDPEYLERIRPGLSEMKRWAYLGVYVGIGDYRYFSRYYKGNGKNMRPFTDNNPVESWRHCPAQQCKVISHGRLWKCPPIMGLKAALEKFDIADSPDWAPYVGYQGIGADSTDEELQHFLSLGPEHICRMCPAQRENYLKDIKNTEFARNSDKVEWEGEQVDLNQLIASIQPRGT